MANEQVETSLIRTIRHSELPAVVGDIAEIGVDAIFDEGLLKDIPVLGSLARFYKTGATIRDHYFLKNLSKFLQELSEISRVERQAMVDRLEADEAYGQRVGESIMLLLDRLDDTRKPTLVGKAFKAYANGNIDGVQLQRVNYAIDRLLMCDITQLIEFADYEIHSKLDVVVGQNFLNAGLAFVAAGYGGGDTRPNELCKLFVKHILS